MNQKNFEGFEVQKLLESNDQFYPLQFQQMEKRQIIQYQINNNPYQYVFINSIEKNKTCYSYFLNHDDTLLLASADSLIKMFQFQIGKIKQIYQVAIHQKDVIILKFSKQQKNLADSFISASDDLSIKIVLIY